MKFLVTGGGGFIGSHIADELFIRGYEVIRADLGGDYRSQDAVQVDITDFEALEKACRGVEGVFHCAAYSKIEDCIKNPWQAYRVNALGTFNVLRAASKNGVRRMVYSSSISVSFKCNEYARTKDLGEMYCLFSFSNTLQTVILRYVNVYGSEQSLRGEAPFPSVIERFLYQRKHGEPLTIVGNGNKKRDFIHIRDVVSANMCAMFDERLGGGETMDIGFGKNYYIKEIAQMVGGPVIFVPERYTEADETLADITKARAFMGWQPRYDVQDWIESHR